MELMFVMELFEGHYVKDYEEYSKIEDVEKYLMKYRKKA